MVTFLKSKRGLTFVEIMIVVVVLGILVGVAIPVYNAALDGQKRKDCVNQRTIIEADVQMVMVGMEDNGKRILTMPINASTGASGTDSYGAYWTLSDAVPTIGQMRSGSVEGKPILKKQSMKDITLASLFTFNELPVCPFDEDGEEGYEYRIYADGKVRCTCPECEEED